MKKLFLLGFFTVIFLTGIGGIYLWYRAASAVTESDPMAEVPLLNAPPERGAALLESAMPPVSETAPQEGPPVSAIPAARQIRQEFLDLRREYGNNDIIGRLVIEGTSINYLVTQAGDNSFYLYHDIMKQPNPAGWVFLDYTNNIARPDRNTIIYGHNMRQDMRFHAVRRFAERDFFERHRYIIFNTVYEDKVWEVFAFYTAHVSFPYIQVIFPSGEDFYGLVNEMKARSWHDAGIQVTASDRILTLSTCAGNDADMRYVLNARLVAGD